MPLIKLDQAADRLGVHVTTVRAWVRKGKIPAYRLGQRFTRIDWEELLGALSKRAAQKRSETQEVDR